MQQMWNRLQLLFAHGVSTLVGNDKVQAKVLDGEVLDNLARVEPYGFSYHPQPGSQSYLLFPSGDRSYGVAIMVGDKRYQMDLQSGEVSLHDDIGHSITLQRGGIAVAGGGHAVTITGAPTVVVTGGDVVADGVSLKDHVHSGVQPGSGLSGPPVGGGSGGGSGGAGGGSGGGVTPDDLNNAISASEAALVATIAQEAAALQTQITTTVNVARSDLTDAIDLASSALEGADLLINDALTTLDTAVAGHTTSIFNLNTSVGNHESNLTTLNQTTADQAQIITSLSSTVGDHSTDLTTLNQTVAGQATSLSNLNTTVGNHSTSLSTLSQTTADQAQSITNLNATVGGHTSELLTLNQTTAAQAQSLTSLSTTVGNHATSISTLDQTTANQAQSLVTLSSTVGGHATSIYNLSTAQNGLYARWGVTLNNNGHITGFATYSDMAANGGTPTSAFVVAAQKFVFVDENTPYALGNTPNPANIPFRIVGGTTYIKSANIEQLSIGTGHAAYNAFTVAESVSPTSYFFTLAATNLGVFDHTNIASMALAVSDQASKRLVMFSFQLQHAEVDPGFFIVVIRKSTDAPWTVGGFTIDAATRIIEGTSDQAYLVMKDISVAANENVSVVVDVRFANGNATHEWSVNSDASFYNMRLFAFTGKR
jgi:phage gp45-like/uncharacterized coiled-coil protein SlyX